jgi:outer membrane protein assembly factor BamA
MAACSPVVKEGYLLVGNTVTCDNSSIDVADPQSYIKQLPSSTLLGMPLHARIYNSVPQKVADSIRNAHTLALDSINKSRIQHIRYKKGFYLDSLRDLRIKIAYYNNEGGYETLVKQLSKDSCKIYKRFRKYEVRDSFFEPKTKLFSLRLFWQNIGEKPVVYNPTLSAKSLEQVKLYMRTKGFYEATVSYSEKYGRNNKVTVNYDIKAGEPHRIQHVYYKIDDDTISKYVLADTSSSLIKTGGNLDVDVLQNERVRVSELLKNNGYYNFRKDYITYTVDTTLSAHSADITMEILPIVMESGRVNQHRRYYISRVFVYPNYNATEEMRSPDSYYESMKTYYAKSRRSKMPVTFLYRPDTFYVKPRTIMKEIFVKSGSLYNQQSVSDTYKHLSAFNIYKMVEVKFDEHTMSRDSLNCNIYLTTNKTQEFVYGLGATNSSGNIGASLSLTYRHRNIFNGAETFDLKYLMSYESQSNFGELQHGFDLNTQEYGLESRLYFPRMLAPKKIQRWKRNSTPRTYVSLYFNYRNRPDYTRTIVNINLNYQFNNKKYISSTLTPIRLSAIDISNADSAFMAWLNRLYIKDSYQDHFILGSGYSIIFNNQTSGRRFYNYIKFNVSWAGNVLNLANRWFGGVTNEHGSYKAPFVKTMYAQFVKADIDFRHYVRTVGTNTVVFRTFAGVGIPYGNNTFMPFTEQYFSGGANSLRAWQIRSVGPGSFANAEATGFNAKYPNMTSDMKLEANLEYRFKIFWVVEGAWFFDAGNIWSINADDKRDGGNFDFKRFYKEIAVGSGFGFRLDFDFFLLRTDFGLKLRDPSLPDGSRWIAKNDKYFVFNSSNWSFCLGIGYPF